MKDFPHHVAKHTLVIDLRPGKEHLKISRCNCYNKDEPDIGLHQGIPVGKLSENKIIRQETYGSQKKGQQQWQKKNHAKKSVLFSFGIVGGIEFHQRIVHPERHKRPEKIGGRQQKTNQAIIFLLQEIGV